MNIGKEIQFSKTDWHELKSHCDEKGIEFISSPFSLAAVDLLEDIGVKRYKIGSGEITNHLLLEYISNEKPIILSSGMSDFKELDLAVRLLKEKKIDYLSFNVQPLILQAK